ncbi:hypothetical protein [Pseudobacillus wudalianchiensis]|uniref:Uncharacterized protein n=1 Tax=Pseudobacillus wudalianchiensis TaxID=1743143 RepID=A0A1B9AY89_9BACI|nr:hypothetical protein [Bacillus wudalianchiensis]OCA88882.1 hypothetical protein A8F95_05480 [Bacillus wudalianchiensis]OCA88885.1 hypothetical protein A8F95_05495 [Bacillus wudalianchiensis]
MAVVSFIILRKKLPKMRQPGRTTLGWITTLLSLAVSVLYLPGMPSALVWPYEWLIVLVWVIFGFVFTKCQCLNMVG